MAWPLEVLRFPDQPFRQCAAHSTKSPQRTLITIQAFACADQSNGPEPTFMRCLGAAAGLPKVDVGALAQHLPPRRRQLCGRSEPTAHGIRCRFLPERFAKNDIESGLFSVFRLILPKKKETLRRTQFQGAE